MKKILLTFFSLLLLIFHSQNVSAHPLDISISTATIKEKTINITTYFHSFEIEYLLKENNIQPDWVNDYFIHQNIIQSYIKNNIHIYQWNEKCLIEDITLIEDEVYKILTDWLWVNYNFQCTKKIDTLKLEVKYFINFPLQTNRFTFYNLNNWLKNYSPFYFKVYTSKIFWEYIDINNKNLSISKDSDNDWLSNEEEKIYFTDINKIDTDWDFYTDKEEIDYWWDPLNKDLWPGQPYREKKDLELSQKQISALETVTQQQVKIQTLKDYWYWSDILRDVMKYIDNFFTKNEWSFYIVFLIVFWLWVIHAIWPGHSKSLLIAYTLEKWNGYKKWFLFSGIFTITHILDILFLFLITKIIVSFIDISKFTYYVQLISGIFLFILSVYLLFRAFKKHQCSSTTNETTSLWVAFFAWLAPCSFAWSIFLLLIALWKSSWIIPLVLALGLWIFFTLSFIVLISIFLKNKAYWKVHLLEKYSAFVSSSLIFIISIILILKVI